MEILSQEYLNRCRKDGKRILRGENMTRIETFVDAAFAFSLTMLVISIDEIPTSPVELLELSKDIPAFLLSAALIGSIWLAHTTWSRTFGLQDGATVFLSLSLVVLVLIFVYPIKLMNQATVVYVSEGVLGDDSLFDDQGWANNSVASLFIYFAIGLFALSTIIVCLYRNALRHKRELVLSEYEQYFCKISCIPWFVVGLTSSLSICITVFGPFEFTTLAGFVYMTMVATIPLAEMLYRKRYPEPE